MKPENLYLTIKNICFMIKFIQMISTFHAIKVLTFECKCSQTVNYNAKKLPL